MNISLILPRDNSQLFFSQFQSNQMERRRNAYGECDVPRIKNVISAVILTISFHPFHIFVPESNMLVSVYMFVLPGKEIHTVYFKKSIKFRIRLADVIAYLSSLVNPERIRRNISLYVRYIM